ncbi:MAG: aconitate hydratase [Pseudomonadales bacterium]|jgi:aconitate hydratase
MAEARNLTRKIIDDHRAGSDAQELSLYFDQALMQDATGTLVMLSLEALGLERVQTELAVQYVDHNLIEADFRNADDHRFLASACRRFGIWFSPPGNGISHPTHMQRFGEPGKTLIGSDSHTCAAGSLGMLAVGAGGSDVVRALAGQPASIPEPRIWGIHLSGALPDWVSAKDVILELLRRHDVDGGDGYILEYHGPGLAGLSAMDRHVIANMGQELGAITSVFPSDEQTERFLADQGRASAWRPLAADVGAAYDREEHIDLSGLVPLIALPSSPGNVVPVTEVAGEEIQQAYIGSSANPGYRDFAIAAAIVGEEQVAPGVSFDVNPTNRQLLRQLMRDGHIDRLLAAGARLHQTGCNGCIGMGQAPATGARSLRTVPRNFAGRSGTREDQVYLCSPETAAASALRGVITDPRTLPGRAPRIPEPEPLVDDARLVPPGDTGPRVSLERGPNIHPLPTLDPLGDELTADVLLTVGNDVSTDAILPAGTRVLPDRSNIDRISTFAFADLAPDYAETARAHEGWHAIVAGHNYGQGSSREHAALAPRVLGLRLVIAESFARIHWQNLINFGVLPLELTDPQDARALEKGISISLEHLDDDLAPGREITARHGDTEIRLRHRLSQRQVDVLRAGGLINWLREQRMPENASAGARAV